MKFYGLLWIFLYVLREVVTFSVDAIDSSRKFEPGILQNGDKEFEPYADNGGTIIGLSGKDYLIIAADTRLADTSKYFISSRKCSRVHVIHGHVILASTGCFADSLALTKQLRLILRSVEIENQSHHVLTPSAIASRLSCELYLRRSLPYYCSCILGGIDADCGRLFSYDPLGSYELVPAYCVGKGAAMIQPMLDEVVEPSTFELRWKLNDDENLAAESPCLSISLEEAISLVLRCFRAASERETSIGDGIEIVVLKRNLHDSFRPQIDILHHALPIH